MAKVINAGDFVRFEGEVYSVIQTGTKRLVVSKFKDLFLLNRSEVEKVYRPQKGFSY